MKCWRLSGLQRCLDEGKNQKIQRLFFLNVPMNTLTRQSSAPDVRSIHLCLSCLDVVTWPYPPLSGATSLPLCSSAPHSLLFLLI